MADSSRLLKYTYAYVVFYTFWLLCPRLLFTTTKTKWFAASHHSFTRMYGEFFWKTGVGEEGIDVSVKWEDAQQTQNIGSMLA